MLLGTYNVTVNITKRYHNSISADSTVNVAEPTSCYHEVYAFDIKYDGSVGTLAIPGEFSTVGESSLVHQCGIDSSSEQCTLTNITCTCVTSFIKLCSLESFGLNATIAVVLCVAVVSLVVPVAVVVTVLVKTYLSVSCMLSKCMMGN